MPTRIRFEEHEPRPVAEPAALTPTRPPRRRPPPPAPPTTERVRERIMAVDAALRSGGGRGRKLTS